jgi:hypothetical protein
MLHCEDWQKLGDPDVGCSKIHRNVGKFQPDYMMHLARRQLSSSKSVLCEEEEWPGLHQGTIAPQNSLAEGDHRTVVYEQTFKSGTNLV